MAFCWSILTRTTSLRSLCCLRQSWSIFPQTLCKVYPFFSLKELRRVVGGNNSSSRQLDPVIGLLCVTEWTSMSPTSVSIWKSWLLSGTTYLSALKRSTSGEVSLCKLGLASVVSLSDGGDEVEVVGYVSSCQSSVSCTCNSLSLYWSSLINVDIIINEFLEATL